jgi:glycosyltransferase involved in cell wall biosynthesis
MPAISIAIPVFNGARFLGEAIASILEQTYGDFELIVVDDGSTDRSVEIARAYAARDARIVLITSEHGGIAAAMNRALAVARGEYFAPMDQDDVALPHRLQLLLGFLELNPEIALAGGGARVIDENGHVGRKKIRPLLPKDVAVAMLSDCAIIHPASLMRTSAARAVGGYRSIMPFAEDYHLWLRLMERYLIANIPDIVLLKRIHARAVTQDRSQRGSQVVARAIVYLSHLARVTFGKDIVCDAEPLLISATRFIDLYLDQCGELQPHVQYNLSRFMRYAPLLTAGPRSVNRPYWLYLTKVLQCGSVSQGLRTFWYLLLYFCYNRQKQDQLFVAPMVLSGWSEELANAS